MICPTCDGTGFENELTCTACRGTGFVRGPDVVITDLVAMVAHLAACYRSGNPIVLRDAFADVHRAMLAMEQRGEINLTPQVSS